jgi:hypothetical protein
MMSDANSPLSPNAQRFLAIMAKLTGRPSTSRTNGPVIRHVNSSGAWFTYRDPGEKILQLPIANEDRLFSFYKDMKAQLANDAVC